MTVEYEVHPILSLPFAEMTYVVHLAGRSDCLVIDPGFEPIKIVRLLESRAFSPAAILNTHGHSDHIAGNRMMKQRWPHVPLMIGAGDAIMLTDPVANLAGLAGVQLTSPPADRLLHEGDAVEAAGLKLEVREIPGHSPGHVVFVWHEPQPKVVFGGDVLFEGSVGRTDLPGGSTERLVAGIREKLFTLPDDTIVYPGHGGPTTVGRERRTNPFVGGL